MEKYYIFVENGHTPTKCHETFEEAEKECNRLATMPNTLNKKIYIMKSVKVYKNIPTLVNLEEGDENEK